MDTPNEKNTDGLVKVVTTKIRTRNGKIIYAKDFGHKCFVFYAKSKG